MAIVEDNLIGKGLIIALAVLGIAGYLMVKASADPSQAAVVLKEMWPYFGMVVSFYLGSRGSGQTTG
jgi:hypothetical protein